MNFTTGKKLVVVKVDGTVELSFMIPKESVNGTRTGR